MPFTNLFLPLRRRTATFRQLLFRAIFVRTLVSDRLSHSLALLLRMASSSPNPFPEKTSVTPDPILRVAAASHLRSTGSGACRMTSTADLMGETPNLAALTTAHRPNARLIVACFGGARPRRAPYLSSTRRKPCHPIRRVSSLAQEEPTTDARHVRRRLLAARACEERVVESTREMDAKVKWCLEHRRGRWFGSVATVQRISNRGRRSSS